MHGSGESDYDDADKGFIAQVKCIATILGLDESLPGVQFHVAFQLPTGTTDNDKLLRRYISALGVYVSDYINTYWFQTEKSILKWPYRGELQQIHTKVVKTSIENNINANWEQSDDTGARVSSVKFASLGIRHGIYFTDKNDRDGSIDPKMLGFEIRNGENKLATLQAIVAVLKLLKIDTGAVVDPDVKMPKWKSVKLSKINANQDALRQIGSDSFLDAVKTALDPSACVGAACKGTVLIGKMIDKVVAGLNSYCVFSDKNKVPCPSKTDNLKCPQSKFRMIPWNKFSSETCEQYAKNLLARYGNCYVSGIEQIDGIKPLVAANFISKIDAAFTLVVNKANTADKILSSFVSEFMTPRCKELENLAKE